jgi:hypothetical protein
MEDPAASGFGSEEAEAAFKSRGTRLADQLQNELGPDFSVSINVWLAIRCHVLRSPSDNEMQLIARIAEKLAPDERAQLLADAANATVESVVPDESRLIFHIAGYRRPSYDGQHSYGAEGTMLDGDSAELEVLLFADKDGRLLELEFVRYDPGDLVGPRWETLNVF